MLVVFQTEEVAADEGMQSWEEQGGMKQIPAAEAAAGVPFWLVEVADMHFDLDS